MKSLCEENTKSDQVSARTCSSGPMWVFVGKIIKPAGHEGWLRIGISSDFPGRFDKGSVLHLSHGKIPEKKLLIVDSRALNNSKFVDLLFEGVFSRELAQSLGGLSLFIPFSERVSAPPDSYYSDEIMGMIAEDPDGSIAGTVIDFQPGLYPYITIQNEKYGEVLVGFRKVFIECIDRKSRRLKLINPISWHAFCPTIERDEPHGGFS